MIGTCIAYYTLDEGFGIASFDCGHWAQLGKVTLKVTDCPVCAQIKAAEDKRGEEVLGLLKDKFYFVLAEHFSKGLIDLVWKPIKDAY